VARVVMPPNLPNSQLMPVAIRLHQLNNQQMPVVIRLPPLTTNKSVKVDNL
jgi:hypothetical protein